MKEIIFKLKKKFITEKFFLTEDQSVIGIYYQGRFSKLTIGGNHRFLHIMQSVMEDYFKVVKCGRIHTARNKVKLICNCCEQRYMKGIERLRKDGFILEVTKHFNRIWW